MVDVLIGVGLIVLIALFICLVALSWDGTIYTSTTTETKWEFDRLPRIPDSPATDTSVATKKDRSAGESG